MSDFYINLTGRNGKLTTIKKKSVKPTSTIMEVKKLICETEEGGSPESLDLTSKGVSLKNDKMLRDYGIVNSRHMIIAIFAVTGGAQYVIRSFNKNDPLIKLSKKADCISFVDDEPRAEMSCGHAITCDNMYKYLQSKAEQLSVIDIKCPVPNCEKIWDYDVIAAVANLSQEDYLKYSCIFDKRRALTNNCQCPHCKSFVKRPDNLSHFRVKCLLCNGSDFCFVCGLKWKGNGMQICGNENCGTKEINDTLQNCPLTIPQYIKLEVPKYRACPRCITLIAHKEKCKHMTCYNCKTNFCFVCLGIKDNDKWPCLSHTYECKVAARQILS